MWKLADLCPVPQIEFRTWKSSVRTFLISLRGSSDARSNWDGAQFTPQRSPSTRAPRIFNFFHAFVHVNSTSDARQEILGRTIPDLRGLELMRVSATGRDLLHFCSAREDREISRKHSHQQSYRWVFLDPGNLYRRVIGSRR